MSDSSITTPRLGGRRSALSGAVLRRASLPAQVIIIASFAIIVTSMFATNWWLGSQIEQNVIRRTARADLIYVESVIAPALLRGVGPLQLDAQTTDYLDRLQSGLPYGREVIAINIWGEGGRVLYSSVRSQIGRVYPVDAELKGAFAGNVTWQLADSADDLHIPRQAGANLLLGTYSPVQSADGHVVAVVELYESSDPLRQDIERAQLGTWLIVGVATLLVFGVLASYVGRSSQTIASQQVALGEQVLRLGQLLDQNTELHDRVSQATRRATTFNERMLRRISAEIHDGPAQYLGSSLLHFDRLMVYLERGEAPSEIVNHAELVDSAIRQAQRELRYIATNMGLPELAPLATVELVGRAVDAHRRRTSTAVDVRCRNLPAQISLPLKIALYRILQEALSNAFRHAGGLGQRVRVACVRDRIYLSVADAGPGFPPPLAAEWDGHLGLSGMRERIETLGGRFSIRSRPGHGTEIRACLPLSEYDHDSTAADPHRPR
jgi:signal transduction histidine kinase